MLVELKTMWKGYTPVPAGKRGDTKLSTILNSPGTFDDKMIVVDASDRGENRGNALPLLLDLARTNIFLHDASVPSLDNLLDPARGDNAPHPFYIANASQRADMVEFLRGLDTESSSKSTQAAMSSPARQRQSSGFPIWAGIIFVFAVGIVGLKIKQVTSSSTP
jgi:hypothetical protein